LIELSVVPVASKNTNSGEMPAARTAFTFRLSGPLVPVQATAGDSVAANAELLKPTEAQMKNAEIKDATARCDNIKFPFIRLLKARTVV
jgi:hypothetical protein